MSWCAPAWVGPLSTGCEEASPDADEELAPGLGKTENPSCLIALKVMEFLSKEEKQQHEPVGE